MKGIVMNMRKPGLKCILGLFVLAIASCTPESRLPAIPTTKPSLSSPLVPPTSASQPDLIITSMYLEMEGRQGHCVNAYSAYGIRVKIKNIGFTDTGAFWVDLNGVVQEVGDGLRPDQLIELHFAGTVPSGRYEAAADVTGQVVESREDNNTSTFHAPTPTPPLLCVNTATATP